MTSTVSRPAGRLATVRAPLAVAAAVIAAFALVAVVDPNEPGHYPACPFRTLTGYYCPGCGGLRAAHALVHGDLATTADRNLLLVVSLPVAAGLWLRWLVVRARGRAGAGHPWAGSARIAGVAGIIVLVAFGLVRNLPWGATLAP